jgi:hypothetical protein
MSLERDQLRHHNQKLTDTVSLFESELSELRDAREIELQKEQERERVEKEKENKSHNFLKR